MAGRAKGVAVSNASVQLVGRSLDRLELVFSCGNATNDASVILKDEDDATTSNGIPLTFGQTLCIEGRAATHPWNAIRLKAADCVVGVLERYSDEFFDAPAVGFASADVEGT